VDTDDALRPEFRRHVSHADFKRCLHRPHESSTISGPWKVMVNRHPPPVIRGSAKRASPTSIASANPACERSVNHAARAGRYRDRQNNVTHQGSPPHRADDLVMASAVESASKPPSASPGEVARPSPGHRSGNWSCHWCGCRCPPFVRREFLRRRTGSIRRQTSPRRTP
jgi:hypothetical protein